MYMYYIIPGIFGYKSFYNNWLQSVPKNIKIHFIEYPYHLLNNQYDRNISNENFNILCKHIINTIFLNSKLNNYNKIILIGHSYGCNIICSIIGQLEQSLKDIHCVIHKCYLLFPFISIEGNKILEYQSYLFNQLYIREFIFKIILYFLYLIISILSIPFNKFKQIKCCHLSIITKLIYNISLQNHTKVINDKSNIFEIIYCKDVYLPLILLNELNVKKHYIDTYHCFMFKSQEFKTINQIIYSQ